MSDILPEDIWDDFERAEYTAAQTQATPSVEDGEHEQCGKAECVDCNPNPYLPSVEWVALVSQMIHHQVVTNAPLAYIDPETSVESIVNQVVGLLVNIPIPKIIDVYGYSWELVRSLYKWAEVDRPEIDLSAAELDDLGKEDWTPQVAAYLDCAYKGNAIGAENVLRSIMEDEKESFLTNPDEFFDKEILKATPLEELSEDLEGKAALTFLALILTGVASVAWEEMIYTEDDE